MFLKDNLFKFSLATESIRTLIPQMESREERWYNVITWGNCDSTNWSMALHDNDQLIR